MSLFFIAGASAGALVGDNTSDVTLFFLRVFQLDDVNTDAQTHNTNAATETQNAVLPH